MLSKNLEATWPIKGDFSHQLPKESDDGCFWQDRGDRRHAGVDLFAPAGTIVVAIQAAQVVQVFVHTSPGICPYWNTTYAISLKLASGIFLRYAELGEIYVNVNQVISCGDEIGKIGQVVLPERVMEKDPPYIQLLKDADHCAMLHLEAFSTLPSGNDELYLGGNYYGITVPPRNLLNPNKILEEIIVSESQFDLKNDVY